MGKNIGSVGHAIQVRAEHDCPECDCSRTYYEYFFWEDPKYKGVWEDDSPEFIKERSDSWRYFCPSCIRNRMWRTLVRIDEIIDEESCYVVVPGWNSDKRVLIYTKDVPCRLYNGKRLHAKVNIGAVHTGDLRFCDWEDK